MVQSAARALRRVTTVCLLATLGVASGCAMSPFAPKSSFQSDVSEASAQLDKFVSVLELIEQRRASGPDTHTASTKVKTVVGEIQRELSTLDGEPTAQDLADKLTLTAERFDQPDLSLLASILMVFAKEM